MKQVKTIQEMQDLSKIWHFEGCKVAVVPTMGALHEGHLSLIRLAKKYAEKIIVTIFVNPTQFGEGEDFESYPRVLQEDMRLCELEGASVVFTPSAQEMYPCDASTWVHETSLEMGYCGGARPGHFRGVTTVVTKLFLATLPDCGIFGEKDYQQLAVIRRMVRDLNFPVQVIGAPLVREDDGLAMSSRNRYLSRSEREASVIINQTLFEAKKLLESGHKQGLAELEDEMKNKICKAGGEIDYLDFVDPNSLKKLHQMQKSMRILAAAKFGPARLLDNVGVELA